MANYIKDSLEEGECIVLKGKLHWTAIGKYVATSALLAILAIASLVLWFTVESQAWLYVTMTLLFAGIVVYVIGSIIRTRTEFSVTNTRFIQKDGIFNVKMTEIPLFKVETVVFTQTFIQRIMGTGCIELVGSGGTNHKIDYVKSPMIVRKTIVGTLNENNNKKD